MHTRRKIFQLGLGLATAGAATALPGVAKASINFEFPRARPASLEGGRTLQVVNLHTGEKVSATYWENGQYLTDGLSELNHVLRDHRTGDVIDMDPSLMDLLVNLRERLGSGEAFHIISGYRSPKTNAMLRSSSSGVAKKSFHMLGQAVDIRLPDRSSSDIRRVAMAMERGGVGYYPKSDFVHIDTGHVRSW